MSSGFHMEVGGTPPSAVAMHDGFTVKSLGRCRVVFGQVPASEFAMLSHGFSQRAVVATDLAERIGATVVIGEPEDVEELRQRKQDLPLSEKRHRDYLAAQQQRLFEVADWLRSGERGMSSNAMCKQMFGIPADAGNHHPLDGDDFDRCLKFLASAKAHERLPLMRDVSPAWCRLVDGWDRLEALFDEETRDGGTATPKTNALILELVS